MTLSFARYEKPQRAEDARETCVSHARKKLSAIEAVGLGGNEKSRLGWSRLVRLNDSGYSTGNSNGVISMNSMKKKPEPEPQLNSCCCGLYPESFAAEITEDCCELEPSLTLMPPSIEMSIGEEKDTLTWNECTERFEGDKFIVPKESYLEMMSF